MQLSQLCGKLQYNFSLVLHSGSSLLVAAQDATEDEEAIEDTVVEDEDDEAEVEEDEPTELVYLQ